MKDADVHLIIAFLVSVSTLAFPSSSFIDPADPVNAPALSWFTVGPLSAFALVLTVLRRSTRYQTEGSDRADIWKVGFAVIGMILIFASGFRTFGIHDASGVAGSITRDRLTCIYFSVMTLTTVGYGDFVPATSFSRILSCFEALIGYGLLGLSIAWMQTYIAHDRRT